MYYREQVCLPLVHHCVRCTNGSDIIDVKGHVRVDDERHRAALRQRVGAHVQLQIRVARALLRVDVAFAVALAIGMKEDGIAPAVGHRKARGLARGERGHAGHRAAARVHLLRAVPAVPAIGIAVKLPLDGLWWRLRWWWRG